MVDVTSAMKEKLKNWHNRCPWWCNFDNDDNVGSNLDNNLDNNNYSIVHTVDNVDTIDNVDKFGNVDDCGNVDNVDNKDNDDIVDKVYV